MKNYTTYTLEAQGISTARQGVYIMKKTLRVIYDGHPDYKMEKELQKVLDKHGYEWYAQGYNFVDEKRDIAYDMPPAAQE